MTDKIVMAIGMPIARTPQPETMNCLFAAMAELRKDPFVHVHLFDPVGYQIDHARNIITQQAIQSVPDLTHIMWIDDDMTFEPDAIRRLLAHDLPIVGGLCFNRRPPYSPILVHFTERGFAFQYDYPEGLVRVDGTGAAFLLTKKEVYQKLNEKDPVGGPWNITTVGEDISFCKRAASVGYKVMVDTTVKIGHIGPININEKTASRLRELRSNPYFAPGPVPKGDPVASIIIPTWNQKPEWLMTAVFSALHQTIPVEIIVIDDGSDTPVAMKDLGWAGHIDGIEDHRFDHVRIVRQDHLGCFHALNRGIKEMRTPWFTWLSSDDILYPPKIEAQLAAMNREEAYASYHGYDVLTAEGMVSQTVISPPQWTEDEQRRMLAQGCWINGLTVMIHESVFDNVGTFDLSYTIASDWELWNRIADEYLWLALPGILATRREYPGTVFNASQRYARDPEKMKVWKEEDDRIRAMYAPKEKP